MTLRKGKLHYWPPPSVRLEAWIQQDPDELRRAADEWEFFGHGPYAEHLRKRANGEKSFMAPPYVRSGQYGGCTVPGRSPR